MWTAAPLLLAMSVQALIAVAVVLMATGLDFLTAFSAVAASLNNLGPGLGEVSANYSGINEVAKGMLCFAMLLGRLELYTVLIIFLPGFWKK